MAALGSVLDEQDIYMGNILDAVKDILKAPVRIIRAGTSAIENVSSGVGSTAKVLPVVLIILAVGFGAYVVLRGKSDRGNLVL